MSMNGREIILNGCELPDLKKFKDYREFVDSDEGPMIQVPTLRESELFHPFYGKLTFDRKLFKQLKNNFENNVIGREIPLQAGHGGMDEPPAHGWVKEFKEVKTDDGKWNLFAFVKPTELGFNSIRNGDYKYASIAYAEHFFDKDDLATAFSEDGDIDFDSKKIKKLDKGPTTLHIALTNTPFVDKQEKVKVFKDPDNSELDKVFIYPEIKGIDWSTALSEQTVVIDDKTKEPDTKDKKGEDVKTDVSTDKKIEATDKTDDKKLTDVKSTNVKELSQEDITELLQLKAKYEKIDIELRNKEIESASEKALARGVDKVTTDFIKRIMNYTQREDGLSFKMIALVEKDGKAEEVEREFPNLYHACEQMLSSIIPATILIDDDKGRVTHSRNIDDDGNDFDNSDAGKAKALSFAQLADPSIVDSKKGE